MHASVKLLLFLASILSAASSAWAAKTLDIYFIDVEGGQATLVVAPNRESLLIDTGWPGNNGRDMGRILQAAKAAGVKRLDYLVSTHYHIDHVGGVTALVEKLPVMTFVDHGENVESGRGADELSDRYRKATASGKRMSVKPGDTIPMKELKVEVVSAAGASIKSAVNDGGRPNPLCAGAPVVAGEDGENPQSVGLLITFGNFRMLDLGDLTKDKEAALVCPANLLGYADLLVVSHHGSSTSSSRALVHALRPRVAVMDNGASKGGDATVYETVRTAPGLEDLWQLHYSLAAGKSGNSPDSFLANLDPACEGKRIDVSVSRSGDFTITNLRNKYSKTYTLRK